MTTAPVARNPFHHSGRPYSDYCRAPGCAACFYRQLMRRPLLSLVLERVRLEHGPRVGCAWPQSNYFRALVRAIADKRL